MSDTPKTVTVTLSEPVTYKEQTYTSLTFRRRKAKEQDNGAKTFRK